MSKKAEGGSYGVTFAELTDNSAQHAATFHKTDPNFIPTLVEGNFHRKTFNLKDLTGLHCAISRMYRIALNEQTMVYPGMFQAPFVSLH